MVDLIQNVQDVYKKWESKSIPTLKSSYRGPFPNNRLGANYALRDNRRAPRFEKRNRTKRFPVIKLPKYHGLAQFKMAPTIRPLNRPRPFMGSSCSKCLPISRAAIPYPYISSLSICNLLQIPCGKRNGKFVYHDVSSNVLESERVATAVEAAIADITKDDANMGLNADEILPKQMHRAKEILLFMKASVSSVLLRLTGWLLYNILSRILNGIQVHKGHIEILKSASQEDIPIIYLPTHRSHFDYLLVSFILYMNDLRVPLVAAGENLRIPVFGNLLQRLGAFFIKRKLDYEYGKKDHVYRSVLQSYMTECLKAGHSLEFFIEGGRSRTGKSRIPKAGLLSVVVDSFLEGCIEDAYITPVSISYEKIIEGNFVSEQLGMPKESESFLLTVYSIWNVLHSNFGSIRVDFGQPFSLKEFLQSSNHVAALKYKSVNIETPPASHSSQSSASGSGYGNESAASDLRSVIKDLAEHIVYDATCSTALMSTQLLAFLLLSKHRKGATQQHLLYSLNWLRAELVKRKRDVGFTGESPDIIKHAVALLGEELIITETIEMELTSSDMENNNVKIVCHKPVVALPYVLELQYYSNAVVPVFLLDSIVVNALYALLDGDICHFQHLDSNLIVMRHELVDKAVELCDILQFEFVATPPCADITIAINDVLEELLTKECLSVAGVLNYGFDRQRNWSPQDDYAFDANDEPEDAHVEKKQQLRIDLSEETIDHLEFLRSILSSYIESYWLAACALLKLVGNIKEENCFLREMQETVQERLHKGLLAYEESFAVETLKTALKLFEFWRITEYYGEDSWKIIYLSDCYDSKEKINDVISRIEQFRK